MSSKLNAHIDFIEECLRFGHPFTHIANQLKERFDCKISSGEISRWLLRRQKRIDYLRTSYVLPMHETATPPEPDPTPTQGGLKLFDEITLKTCVKAVLRAVNNTRHGNRLCTLNKIDADFVLSAIKRAETKIVFQLLYILQTHAEDIVSSETEQPPASRPSLDDRALSNAIDYITTTLELQSICSPEPVFS